MLGSIKNFLAPIVHAQSFNIGNSQYFNPLTPLASGSNPTLASVIDRIIGLMLAIAGALAVIYLLYAGISYITAGGEPAKAEKARTGIVNAIIGIIIIVLSFVIEKVVANLFA